jgi:hypothetical protein
MRLPVSEAAACKASAVGYREQTYISMYFFMQAFDGWTLLLLAGQVVLLPRHGFWHILAKYGDGQCGVLDFQPDLQHCNKFQRVVFPIASFRILMIEFFSTMH